MARASAQTAVRKSRPVAKAAEPKGPIFDKETGATFADCQKIWDVGKKRRKKK